MANVLNTASSLQCPHGGSVSVVTSNTRVQMGGSYVLRASDTFTIAGCPFTLGASPHPCTQVNWVQPAVRCQVAGDFTLTEDSIGMCEAADMAIQGTVVINFTQAQVSNL